MKEARFPVPSSSSLMTGGEGDAWTRDTGEVCGFNVEEDNVGGLIEDE